MSFLLNRRLNCYITKNEGMREAGGTMAKAMRCVNKAPDRAQGLALVSRSGFKTSDHV
jgi:hypothetical protein